MADVATKTRRSDNPERVRNRRALDEMIREQYIIDTLVEPWTGLKLVLVWILVWSFSICSLYLLYIMIWKICSDVGLFVQYSMVGHRLSWHSSIFILSLLGILI